MPGAENKRPVENVNRLSSIHQTLKLLETYNDKMKINDVQMKVLKDSGASVDVTDTNHVAERDLTREVVWIK